MPEANYYVVENPTIEKTLEESCSKAEKEVKGKSKEKGKRKEKYKGKGKDKGKNKEKSKEKEIKLDEIGFDLIYMQRNNVV